MAFLVRKIVISRWPDGLNSFFTTKENLSADSITKELNTSKNMLSWWRIEKIEKIIDIGLSFVSKLDLGQRDMRLLALPFETIDAKFDLQNTPENGDTAIPSLKQYHYDICNLTFGSLGDLATLIAQETIKQDNGFIVKIKVKDAIESIKLLLEEGKADSDLLGEYIKKELGIN